MIQETLSSLPLFQQQGIYAARSVLSHTCQDLGESWAGEAYSAIVAYARQQTGSWTAEDCVEAACLVAGEPEDRRAFGALLAKLKRDGIAKQTDEFYRRKHGHGVYARKWQTIS